MSVLVVDANTDFRAAVLTGVDEIRFADSVLRLSAVFDGSQFDDIAIFATASIFGGSGVNILKITNCNFFSSLTLRGIFDWQSVDRFTVSGTRGNDSLVGSAANETFIGGAGNDRFRGEGGNDRLIGGIGNDSFLFSLKFDSLGNTFIDGGADLDTIIVNGAYHDFTQMRISNVEALEFTNPSVSATFTGTQFGGHSGISQVKGGIFADYVVVKGDNIDLSRVTFTDWDPASDGITIRGDNAGSRIIGSYLDDKIEGGTGRDLLDFHKATGPVTGNLGLGMVSSSTTGFDEISGIEVILGSNFDDILTGDTLGNEFYGGSGSDRLVGGMGSDFLFGDAGSDTVFGEGGLDFVSGGRNADTLSGGLDSDIYYYDSKTHGRDRILDFVSGEDQFHFRAGGFNVEGGYLLQGKSTFISNKNPMVRVDAATVLYDSDTGRLFFDSDGTGIAAAVLIATITGAPSIGSDDIVFI